MADAVTSQTIFDSPERAIFKFTNVSDGTGEAAVLKIDISALNALANRQTPTRFTIRKIWWVTAGMSVQLLWDADTDVIAFLIPPDDNGCLDFSDFSGIPNNAGTGVTGDLMLTTVGHTAADTYLIVVEIEKS